MLTSPANKWSPLSKADKDDLEVMRLLVEVGRLEQIDNVFFMLGLMFKCVQSRIPPALEYLSKQEHFEFSLSDVFTLDWSPDIPSRFPEVSSLVRAFCVCGGDVNMTVHNGGNSLIYEVAYKFAFLTFSNPDASNEQLDLFNQAVITFCLCLKQGFHPSTKLPFRGNELSVSTITFIDPDFAAVAWRLALVLHGWILPPPSETLLNCAERLRIPSDDRLTKLHWSDDETDDESDRATTHPEKAFDQTLHDVENTYEDSEDELRVPGAWVDHETDDDDVPLPPRQFRSRFRDFDGYVRGYQWDESLYLPSENGAFDLPWEERIVLW